MKTILVVEDDFDTRETLVELLREQAYDVRSAGDGREALRHLTEYSPHVALIDLVLPRMAGGELVAIMKLAPALSTIPIVVMSALASPPPLPEGVDLLRKPFELDVLFRAVRRALLQRCAADAESSTRREAGDGAVAQPASGVFKTPWPRPGLAKGGPQVPAVRPNASAWRSGPPFRS